ncbi:MAG: hypothetical protein AAF399_24295 [Bacteroidota bacterium]
MVNRIRKWNADLWKLLLAFLSIERFQAQPLEVALHQFEGLSQLTVAGGAREFQAEHVEDHIQASKMSPTTLLTRHQLWASVFARQHQTKQQPDLESYEQAVQSLDEYYFTQRLIYELEALTLYPKLQSTSSMPMLYGHPQPSEGEEQPPLLAFFQNRITQWNPLAQICDALLQASQEEGGGLHFKELIPLLDQHATRLDPASVHNLATACLNLLIRLQNHFPERYREPLLKHYLQFINHGWICVEDQLEERHFNNVITLSLQQKLVNIAEELYESWSSRLLTTDSTACLLFNQGAIWLEKGALDLAEKTFHQLFQTLDKEDDFLFEVKVRQMLMRVYFLQGWENFPEFRSNCQRHIRNRKQLSQARKNRELKYISILYQLWKWRQSIDVPSREHLDHLRKQIREQPRPAMWSWLLEQVNELDAGLS